VARRPRLICPSAALAERGAGVRFRIAEGDAQEKGFAVRAGGTALAYVNRCPHVGTELDWEPGQFFDFAGLYLVCSTHGALFVPESGYCVAGPCRGACLQPIAIRERDGHVYLAECEPRNEDDDDAT
jgi:nitrite reductase/ring-hydroxylating ferredoxin subunit